MLTDFMRDVLAQLTNKINNDKPLTSWDSTRGILVYHGNPNDKLVPMIKNRHDDYIKNKKYCK